MRGVLYCEFWFRLRLTIYRNIGYKLSLLFITIVASEVVSYRLEFKLRGINRGLKGGGTLEFK